RVLVSSPRAGTAAAVARTVRASTAGMGPGGRVGAAVAAPGSAAGRCVGRAVESCADTATRVARLGMSEVPFANEMGTLYGTRILLPIGNYRLSLEPSPGLTVIRSGNSTVGTPALRVTPR